MPNSGRRRRAVLGSIGTLALTGAAVGGLGTDDASTLAGSVQAQSDSSCTPGHTEGTGACTQIRTDREVLTRFDASGTGLDVTFSYPCGWLTTTTQYDDRIQANTTRSGIGEDDASVDVQIRHYTEPVSHQFITRTREDGDYEDVDYEYQGSTRTGLVSSVDTAQFGTTAHATVPSRTVDGLRHVEFVSTLKNADCPDPRPDYLLVKRMLESLVPNLANPAYPQASVTLADQQVSGEVATQSIVVSSVTLSEGGFVSLSTASPTDGVTDIVGVSSYLEGQHDNVRVALDETITEGQRLFAVTHMDTDEDNVYEFGDSPGLDRPYMDETGTPVHDSATIGLVSDTPAQSDTLDEVETTRFPTATRTATPSPTASPSPTPPSESPTATGSGDSGPGFGVAATGGGLSLATVAFLRRHLSPEDE